MATEERLKEIAAELRAAATWVTGPRERKLHVLAHELEGKSPEEAAQAVDGPAPAPTAVPAEQASPAQEQEEHQPSLQEQLEL